jgi:hypothetical protein
VSTGSGIRRTSDGGTVRARPQWDVTDHEGEARGRVVNGIWAIGRLGAGAGHQAAVHTVAMPGWQIGLIAIGLLAACAAVAAYRAWAAGRRSQRHDPVSGGESE